MKHEVPEEHRDAGAWTEFLVEMVLTAIKEGRKGKSYSRRSSSMISMGDVEKAVNEQGYEAISRLVEQADAFRDEKTAKVWSAVPCPDDLQEVIETLEMVEGSLEGGTLQEKLKNGIQGLQDVREAILEAVDYQGLRKEALRALEEGKDSGLDHEADYLDDYIKELEIKLALTRTTLLRARMGWSISEDPTIVARVGVQELKMWAEDSIRGVLLEVAGEIQKLIAEHMKHYYDISYGQAKVKCLSCEAEGELDEGGMEVHVIHEDHCGIRKLTEFVNEFKAEAEEEDEDEELHGESEEFEGEEDDLPF